MPKKVLPVISAFHSFIVIQSKTELYFAMLYIFHIKLAFFEVFTSQNVVYLFTTIDFVTKNDLFVN